MKTLDDFKNEVGKEHGHDEFPEIWIEDYDNLISMSAERYAQYMCEQQAPKWINVLDELPKGGSEDSIYCLVKTKTYGIVVRPFSVYHNVWDDEDADDTFTEAIGGEVTHWMRLPDPPLATPSSTNTNN